MTLAFTAADDPDGSGMTGGSATTEHKLDGGLWTSGAGVTVPAPGDHSGDGLRTVRYRSCDAAGNCEAIRSVTVRIDTTAPTASASAGGAWLRGAAAVRLSAADQGSGVASITYILDGAETTVAGADAVVGVPAVPNARHTLVYRATDALGTTCAEQTLSFAIDTRGPTTAGKRVGGRKGRKTVLRYRVADDLSPKAKAVTVVVRTARGKKVKTFTVGTRKTATWCSVTWVPRVRGAYRYYVYATDLAGNAQRRVGSARVVVR